MGARRKSREIALQALYQAEMNGLTPETSLDRLCGHFEVSSKAIPYARDLVLGIVRQAEAIDGRIRQYADNWRLERMSVIDRNIIRLAVFELCFQDDVPARVAINEAIEVAKRFSTDDSGAFINGVLDAINRGQATVAPPADDTE